IESLGSTSRAMVLPVRVLTKICIAQAGWAKLMLRTSAIRRGEYSCQVTPPPTLPELRRKGALLSQLIARVTPAPGRPAPKAGQGAQLDKAIHGASGGNRTRTTEVERF